MKPPRQGSAIGYHQDSWYISEQFKPVEDNSITCWIPLDDTDESVGTIEYLKKSHTWKTCSSNHLSQGFHGNSNYTDSVEALIPEGTKLADHVVKVCIPAGGISFHHQNLWHGSGVNRSSSRWRRAIVVHVLRGDVLFDSTRSTSYIYGRYRMHASVQLEETFFPIIFPENLRSKVLSNYVQEDPM